MEFRISSTFQDSLAKLTKQEQKITKTTAFDLQINPANPGFQFHRVENAKDKNFWSVRVNRDIRIIIHKTEASFMLCYVDHHDKAYSWAQRRKIEKHPRTGATQIVEVRELVHEVPVYSQAEVDLRTSDVSDLPLFQGVETDDLLVYGVPEEWIEDVKSANEEKLLQLADHLPQEASEALLELATGGTPELVSTDTEGFEHPDAQRRFRLVADQEELALALEYPWEKWTVFLHPSQRDIVTKLFKGPARISGSAGTGKTVVLIHRAVHLAKSNPDANILLTTFSEVLASLLEIKLWRLIDKDSDVAKRIHVRAINRVAEEIVEESKDAHEVAEAEDIRLVLDESADQVNEGGFSSDFLFQEWNSIVDAWQIDAWESYKKVPRLGRRTRLPEAQRERIWNVMQAARAKLQKQGKVTWPMLFHKALEVVKKDPTRVPYDFILVDEAQDMGVLVLNLLGEIAGDRPDGLFFAGDLGQRIFQTPFSWESLGVSIRGRSRTLKVNYRTTHQIRQRADKLLPDSVSDIDGNKEERGGTVSVFNGPPPVISLFDNKDKEIDAVAQTILDWQNDGHLPDEIGVFVRSDGQMPRARAALKAAGVDWSELERTSYPGTGRISISTMHLAKGLEYKAVIVMACDDEVLPLESRVRGITDEADLEEVYATERHLLYVAATRARDHLLLTGIEPGSEFFEDMEV